MFGGGVGHRDTRGVTDQLARCKLSSINLGPEETDEMITGDPELVEPLKSTDISAQNPEQGQDKEDDAVSEDEDAEDEDRQYYEDQLCYDEEHDEVDEEEGEEEEGSDDDYERDGYDAYT